MTDTLQAGDDAAASVSTAPRVALADLHPKIANVEFAVFGGRLTVCVLTLANGFIVTGESSAVSVDNFNEELGRQFARDRAVSKMWELEGYLLRQRLNVGVDDVQLAEIAHEVNRAWCEFNGDTSQPRWADAPAWQRESAINGMAFHRANPDAGDSASHDSWMAEKVAAGWVYGPEKDPEASPPEHPCLVPFGELPRDQQFKDRLFRTIAHAGFAG